MAQLARVLICKIPTMVNFSRTTIQPLLLSILLTIACPSLADMNSCEVIFKTANKKEEKQELPYRKFKPEIKAPPDVTLFRFSGAKSFQEARSANYKINGNGFEVSGGIRVLKKNGFREDESIISELQGFPLQKMTETGYISPEEAKMFKKLGTTLETGQVNFFDVTRKITEEEKAQYPWGLLNSRTADSREVDLDFNSHVRTASLWSIGGQVVDSSTRTTKSVKLPWELEEARKGQALDRTKYKYVWEWGRAAQDIPDEITKVYSANAALNYIELLAHGGKLEDAYVMFHSFDKVNTRLYLAEHPGSTYPVGWDNPNDMLFMVPLKDILKRYPPSKFSSRVDKIIKLSNGKIGELEALELMVRFREMRWLEYDLVGFQNQVNPIVVHDPSVGQILNLWIALTKYKVTESELHSLMDHITQFAPALHTSNTNNKYMHASDALRTGHTYAQEKSIEIANLDPHIAQRDPNYVVSVVYDTYINYVHRLSVFIQQSQPQLTKLEANNEAIRLLVEHKIKFGVSTSEEAIKEQCKHLQPTAEHYHPKTIRMDGSDPELDSETPYWYHDTNMYMYSMEQILQWSREHTEYFINNPYRLKPNYWWSQYYLSQVDLL